MISINLHFIPTMLISLLLGILYSYVSLETLDRVVWHAGRFKHFLLLLASLTMGFGIWSSELIGFIAWEPTRGLQYSWSHLLLSYLYSVWISGMGFYLYFTQLSHRTKLTLASILYGLNITGSYVLLSYALHAVVDIHIPLLILFLMLSIVCSYLGFIKFCKGLPVGHSWLSAILMGSGICLTYLAGTWYTQFDFTQSREGLSSLVITNLTIEHIIAFGTLLLLLLLSTSASYDRRKAKDTQDRYNKELRFGSMFLNHPELVAELDYRGIVRSVNPVVASITGYADHEVLHRKIREFMVEDSSHIQGHLSLCLSGSTGTIPVMIRHKKGHMLHLECTYIPILDKGKVDGMYVICKDVTDTVRMQQALVESEEKYRFMVENAKDMLAVLDLQGHFIYTSTSCAALLDFEHPNVMLGKHFGTSFICEDELARVNVEYQKLVTTGEPILVQIHVLGVGGQIYCLESRATLVRDSEGNPDRVLVISRDITEQRRMHEALQESEARYRQLAQSLMENEQLLRDSQAIYLKLQESLEHFSSDVYGVVQKKELEIRLLKEVGEILGLEDVVILEEDASGPDAADLRSIPIGELREQGNCYRVKISQMATKATFLVMGQYPPLLELNQVQLWLKTIARYTHVLYDTFRVIRDLTQELEHQIAESQAAPWLLRIIFSLSETERKKLSQDLHDTALQEQIIWYRKLEALCKEWPEEDPKRRELERVCEGLLDVIYQIRLTCNELRPPLLMENGLFLALEYLFHQVQLRSDFKISFEDARQELELFDDLSIGIYRILQELLANAAKHSNASEVFIQLFAAEDTLYLRYTDNGIGMDVKQVQLHGTGMGLNGMIERVRSLEGTILFDSSTHKGLEVSICFPLRLIAGTALSTMRGYSGNDTTASGR